MIIKISESLIHDYLTCPMRVFYRTNYTGESIQTPEQAQGSIIHKVLEVAWKNSKEAILEAEKQIKIYNLKLDTKFIYKCIGNFFSTFRSMIKEGDEIEKYFKIPYGDNVQLVGRLDRITNGIVIDWKSGMSEPEDIERDIQCMFYYLAYKKIYNKEPIAIYLAYLAKNKLIMYKPNKIFLDQFEHETIPYVINGVRNKIYPHNGLFQFRACRNCSYNNICWTEMGVKD
jgi:CRISPR/Cas system-associated exonuclease Cas4 (RecB family)